MADSSLSDILTFIPMATGHRLRTNSYAPLISNTVAIQQTETTRMSIYSALYLFILVIFVPCRPRPPISPF